MFRKCGLEDGQLPVGFEASEAFFGFEHSDSGSAQGHLCVPPAFDVPADLPDYRVHRLNDVGAGQ